MTRGPRSASVQGHVHDCSTPASPGSSQHTAAHEVLSALPAQLQSHDEHKESFTFLEAFCQDKSLLALIKVHEKLQQFVKNSPAPSLHRAWNLLDDLTPHLKNKTNNADVQELLQLLTKAHFKALLTVHDAVAWKEFEPTLPPFTVDLLEDSESVKVVQLVKNREPLGATIKRHEVTGEITVARIMHGGAAHRSGLLRVGDELKEVNGVRVDRKEPKEVTRILSRGQDYITLKIIPALKVESESAEKKIFLRALCEYKPADDPAIPCSEAGLAFRCGDVLEVMSQDDPTWWQARHMGKSPACAGLIPSQAFMGRRLESRRRASTQTAHGNSKLFPSGELISCKDASSGHEMYIAALRRSFFMGKRSTKVCKASPEYKCRDKAKTPIPGPYEEVVQYRRQPHETFRLVVFVGSPNTDLSELKAELIASNPRHFATIIPTTTRSRKHDEKDGVDFHFVSRNSFDTGLQNYKFVDYSEFKGHMYGVAFDDIRAVLKMGKVCVLDIAVQAISAVRTAEFKPYIVFVKVPCVEALADCADSRWPSSECYGSRVFGEEEKSSTLLEEEQFGHLFDTTLEGGNRESILRELLETLHLLESHPSWIPRPWTVSHPL